MANYAHELGVLSPQQWLWDQLEAKLTNEEFAALKNGHAAQQRRYSRCSVLNKQERLLWRDDLNTSKWRAILADPAAYVFSEEASK